MAQQIIRSIESDGKEVLSNILDKDTGKLIEFKQVSEYYDGTPMSDDKLDIERYLYIKNNGKYYLRVLDNPDKFLEKDTMLDMRNISNTEILLLKMGYYKGVKLNGYYTKGDTPAPIEYYLSSTSASDDGGSVIDISGIKLEHKFIGEVNVRYFGAKGDGLTNSTDFFINTINYIKNTKEKLLIPVGVFLVDSILLDAENLIIHGEGTIKSSGLINDHTITISGDSCKISGITIDGNGKDMIDPPLGDGAHCLSIVASNCNIEKVTMENAYNKMCTIIGSNNIIKECTFNADYFLTQNQDCIQIYGGVTESRGNIIIGNTFNDCVRSGVYLDIYVTETNISYNKFYNKEGQPEPSAIVLQGYGDKTEISNNTCHNFRNFINIRCGYGSLKVQNNNVYGILSKFIAITGQDAIFNIISMLEPIFSQIQKTKEIGGNTYYYLVDSAVIRNNNIGFSNTLVESDTSVISIIGFSERYSYINNIEFSDNTIKSGDSVISALIRTNLQQAVFEVIKFNDNISSAKTNHIYKDFLSNGVSKLIYGSNVISSLQTSERFAVNGILETSEFFDTSIIASTTIDFGMSNRALVSAESPTIIYAIDSHFKEVTLVATDENVTLENSSTIKLKSGANKTLKAFETITFYKMDYLSPNIWLEK